MHGPSEVAEVQRLFVKSDACPKVQASVRQSDGSLYSASDDVRSVESTAAARARCSVSSDLWAASKFLPVFVCFGGKSGASNLEMLLQIR